MKKTTNKTDRLDLRVSPEQKEFVEMQAKKQNKNKQIVMGLERCSEVMHTGCSYKGPGLDS